MFALADALAAGRDGAFLAEERFAVGRSARERPAALEREDVEAERFAAVEGVALERFAVARFAVARFAVDFFAVDFFAAADRRAPLDRFEALTRDEDFFFEVPREAVRERDFDAAAGRRPAVPRFAELRDADFFDDFFDAAFFPPARRVTDFAADLFFEPRDADDFFAERPELFFELFFRVAMGSSFPCCIVFSREIAQVSALRSFDRSCVPKFYTVGGK